MSRYRYTLRVGEEEVTAVCKDLMELKRARVELRQAILNAKGIFSEFDPCRTHQCFGFMIKKEGISKKTKKPYKFLHCSEECGFKIGL